MRRAALAALAALLVAGCATHIAPYKPKQRKFDPGDLAERPRPTGASLWANGQAGLFDDDRARHVGDILIVRIDEADQASRDDTTNLDRSSKTEIGMPGVGVFGALAAKFPSVDPATLLGTSSEQSFSGGGRIQRKGQLTATLPVRVRKVLANGDLYVEGTKVVMIGREEQHLYLSGIVRASDVGPDNTVRSSRIAEAEIEMVGRGDVADTQKPGWLWRVLSVVNPF